MYTDLTLPMDDCDFFIHLEDLPLGVGGFVSTNSDGTYTMVLNRNHLYEQQQEDYWHEYMHLACDDFGNGRPIGEIEGRK